MPKGPQGQKRPVSDVACATQVMKIAIGEVEERLEKPKPVEGSLQVRNGGVEEELPLIGSDAPLPE
ncbi:MAG: hypothetical protein OXH52_16235 [Gammaproteobacteria bacterium]|nr:hypothetical protein [Gammaproteobacteria bacterium]